MFATHFWPIIYRGARRKEWLARRRRDAEKKWKIHAFYEFSYLCVSASLREQLSFWIAPRIKSFELSRASMVRLSLCLTTSKTPPQLQP
jgi:hypothetical protein